MRLPITLLLRTILVFSCLILSTARSDIKVESSQWVPYTTTEHAYMASCCGFSERLYAYLRDIRKFTEPRLTKEFNKWFPINLGHVFEEAALDSYQVSKNIRIYNGRIPDGVEDGLLEQMMQYTYYPASTFIEVKFMSEISLANPRLERQIKDMIDFLAIQELHQTYSRYLASSITPNPGKASEEELAILVLITPANCIVKEDVIEYASSKQVILYQMKMMTLLSNRQKVTLTHPNPLTKPSRHLFGHLFTPKTVTMPWERSLIDPNTGLPVFDR